MGILSLTHHGPAELTGMTVAVNETEYKIGQFIHRGSKFIVHRLVNTKSNICLHLIKIWRDQEDKRREHLMDMHERMDRSSFIPTRMYVKAHGGYFILEDYIGPYDDREKPTTEILIAGGKCVKSGDVQRGISFYEEALELNPHHTVAMQNLAYAYAELGKFDESYSWISKAVQIETNFYPYYQLTLRYAIRCGAIQAGIAFSEQMLERFPFKRDEHKIVIGLYLSAGQPERALSYLTEMEKTTEDILGRGDPSRLVRTPYDPEKWNGVRENVEADIENKKRSLEVMAQAKKMILANDRDSVLNVLERASTIYSRNPELEINYAFALRRGGQYDEAKKRLLSLVNVMIPFFVKYCFANAAFCAIHLSRYEEAVLLLEETMTVLKKEAPGETPELFSVPGIAIWVDRELAEEENFLKTSKLIDSALRSVIPYSSIPESVKQLASLYRQLGKQWPGSNSR